MTQTEQILAYIEEHGSIDPLRAMTELGIFRLSARVYDLRAAGQPIVSVTKTRRLPNGGTKCWAEYKKVEPLTAGTDNGSGDEADSRPGFASTVTQNE